MGYSLSSLAKLPYDKDNDFYIFLLGSAYYNGGLLEKLCNNFDLLAKEIGPNAVIAKGFNIKEWTLEISQKYFKDIQGIYEYFPGILITNSHPDDFDDNSVRILISLKQVDEKFANIEQFFDLLINFVRKKDDEFIKYAKGKIHWVDKVNESVDLKPNVIGFGININALIRNFKKTKKPFIEGTV